MIQDTSPTVAVEAGEQPGPDDEGTEEEGRGDAEDTDRRGLATDLDQIGQAGLQADLQQQHDHPQFGQEGDDRVPGNLGEIVDAHQPQIAQGHPQQQFAEYRGKTDALGQGGEQAGAHQNQRQPQQVLSDHAGTGRPGEGRDQDQAGGNDSTIHGPDGSRRVRGAAASGAACS